KNEDDEKNRSEEGIDAQYTPAGQVHSHAQQSAAVTPQVSLLPLAIFGGASGTEAIRLLTRGPSLLFSPQEDVQKCDREASRHNEPLGFVEGSKLLADQVLRGLE